MTNVVYKSDHNQITNNISLNRKDDHKHKDLLKQKMMGISLLLISLISTFISGDGTAAVLLIPFSFWIILSKNKMFML